MKKVWSFLNTTLGLGLLVVLLLVLVALFRGRNVVGLAGQPLATVTPVVKATPTSMLSPVTGLRVERLQVVRMASLQIQGAELGDPSKSVFLNPAWSPDGNKVLWQRSIDKGVPCFEGATGCGVWLGELWLVNPDGSSAELLAERAEKGVWSPDGKRIAYIYRTETGGIELEVMNANGGDKREIAKSIKSDKPAWIGNDTLVYAADDGDILSINLTHGEIRKLNPPSISKSSWKSGRADEFELSPDGRRLVIVDSMNRLWLLNLDKGGEPVEIQASNGFANITGGLAWSPDSNKFAYCIGKTGINITNTEGETITHLNTGWLPNSVVWSPDGNVIAYLALAEERGATWEIYLVSIDGSENYRLTESKEEINRYSLSWSPDGTRLIYGISPAQRGRPPGIIELTTK